MKPKSQISDPPTVRTVNGVGIVERVPPSGRRQIGNLRYSRLEICATASAPARRLSCGAWVLGGLVALAAAQPRALWACAACYGQSDSPMAQGMNWGILSLLGIVILVLGGVAAFFVSLARRSAALAATAKSAGRDLGADGTHGTAEANKAVRPDGSYASQFSQGTSDFGLGNLPPGASPRLPSPA
jgi:hypothetical protein